MDLTPTEMLDIIMCLKKGISIESWLKSKNKNISVDIIVSKLKREYGINDKLLLFKGALGNIIDLTASVSSELSSKVSDIAKNPANTIDILKSINVPDHIAAARYSICSTCPNLIDDRCKLCGCNMRTKVQLSTMSCIDTPNRWKDVV